MFISNHILELATIQQRLSANDILFLHAYV